MVCHTSRVKCGMHRVMWCWWWQHLHHLQWKLPLLWRIWALSSICLSSIFICFSSSDIIIWSPLFCIAIILLSLLPRLHFLDLLPLPGVCFPLPDGCVSLSSMFTRVLLLEVWLGVGLWTTGTIVPPDMSWVCHQVQYMAGFLRGSVECLGPKTLSRALKNSLPFTCRLSLVMNFFIFSL